MADKVLVCKDCGSEFIFSEGEQQFYAEKGFQNEPVRCKACRNARKSAGRRSNNRSGNHSTGFNTARITKI